MDTSYLVIYGTVSGSGDNRAVSALFGTRALGPARGRVT